jgi:magnesium-transporting ATPase (P-type)
MQTAKPTPFFRIWLKQCTDAVLLIVLAAGFACFFALQKYSAGIIFWFVYALGTVLNSLMEWATAEGGTALQGMSAQSTSVIRDGQEISVPTKDLVPGDVVHVKSGEWIPADMRIATAIDLRMDESVLTGESQEVTKTAEALPEVDLDPFPLNMLFSGTACVAGKGLGIVTATGMQTQVGQIAKGLDNGIVDLSPLQKMMNDMGNIVGYAAVLVIIIITATCYFLGYQNVKDPCQDGDRKCFFFAALEQGFTLAVSLTPTSMPTVIAGILYVARYQIQKRNAEVRKSSTVETLGSCMAICSDKTGTLTEGRMTAIKLTLPRSSDCHRFAFYPTAGADPAGAVFKEDHLNPALKDAIDAVVAKNASEFPGRSYGREQGSRNRREWDADDEHVRTVLAAASLNCYGTRIIREAGKWVTVGNTSEGALVVAAAKAGIGWPCEGLRDLICAADTYRPEKSIEVPFSSSRKMSCTVHSMPTSKLFVGLQAPTDATHVAIVKGAPEKLLPLVECSLGVDSGTLVYQQGCPSELRDKVLEENNSFANEALRVLLLCVRFLNEEQMKQIQSADIEERVTFLTKQLAILGTFGISDPPRISVAPAIAICQSAGIRVVMITGDQIATAIAIGLRLNIIQESTEARLCADLHNSAGDLLADDVLDKMVLETRVWARAQPADKVTIVEALQRMRYITAMTGDGVNDAPALKLADIGTAMGITGTEVAKGSADIVLLDDDFTTIVTAVEAGRRTFANIQAYILYYLTISFPESFSIVGCLVLGIPLSMSPAQIMMMSLITNVFPPMMLGASPVRKDAMITPPRQKERGIVPRSLICWIVLPWAIIGSALSVGMGTISPWMHTGFFFAAEIVGTAVHEAVKDGKAACEFAYTRNQKTGEHTRDTLPFHCRCEIRVHPLAPATILEQWGMEIKKDMSQVSAPDCKSPEDCINLQRNKRGVQNLRRPESSSNYWSVIGKYETPLYKRDSESVLRLLEICPWDHTYWCWVKPLEEAAKPLLDAETNCGVLGTNAANTMCMLATVIAKCMMVLVVAGIDRSFAFCWLANLKATVVSLLGVLVALFIVYLPTLLHSDLHGDMMLPTGRPLPLESLAMTVALPYAAHVILDFFKSVYRYKARELSRLKQYHAKAISDGLLSPHARQDEIQESMMHRTGRSRP